MQLVMGEFRIVGGYHWNEEAYVGRVDEIEVKQREEDVLER